MTNAELSDYLQRIAVASGMPATDLGKLASDCISLGLKDFWGASEWSFRTQEYDLSISSSTDDYALPSNFAGVTTCHERDSLSGRELTFYPKAEFDKMVPDPTAHSATYPQIYTVWYDNSGNGTWYIRFFPMPSSGHTITMEIVTKPPPNASAIPEDFVGGLIACAQKYLYPLGKAERLNAWTEARNEIKRLEILDSPYRGRPFQFFDDTDNQTGTIRWYQL